MAFTPYSVSPRRNRPDARAEANEELGRLDPECFGGEKMAELMDGDEYEDGDDADSGAGYVHVADEATEMGRLASPGDLACGLLPSGPICRQHLFQGVSGESGQFARGWQRSPR